MKVILAAAVACAALTVSDLAVAQTTPAIPPTTRVQVPIPKTAADVPGPVPGNTMTNAYVQLVGRMAYVWGYPMVNAHNRRAAFAEAPEPGLLGGIVPVAPVGYNQMLTDYVKPDETFIVCPNQDVAYGAGFTALDKEPTVDSGAGLRRPLLRLCACMTSAPTRSAGSASSMARSPAST